MFWICAENSVDNIGMFLLLLSRAYTESRPFLLLTPPARRLGVHKKLGGDTARTADPSWPKGCPTPFDVMLNIYRWGKKNEGGDIRSLPK